MIVSPLRCELSRHTSTVSFLKRISASFCTNSMPEKVESVFPDIETKLLKVGIIGMPNSGKSTFINNLMDRKVCPASSKAHTTRSKSMAIFTEDDSQIVFLDTPGLVSDKEKKKFNLENAFVKDSKYALREADLIGVIHDASNIYTREVLDIKVIHMLEKHKEKTSFLVLNKVDLLKSKRKLLDITRLVTDNCINGKPVPGPNIRHRRPDFNKNIKGWPYFRDIFMVSALTGDGLAEVKNYLVSNAKPAQWMFPDKVFMDRSPEDLIVRTVHATLLNFLPQEIPYSLKPKMEYFEINNEGSIVTVVVVKSPSTRISKLIAGEGDGKLRQIIQSVQEDLQNAFQNFVRIRIVLDPPPNPS